MRIHYQLMLKQSLQDLNPIFMGESECEPSHEGHASQSGNCYVLYRIYRGKGKVRIGDTTYSPRPGQFFLIPPGELGSFTTDKEDPWFFQWIGFTGTLAHDFLSLPPVFDVPPSLFARLYDPRTTTENLVTRITSDLFLLHATLTHPAAPRSDYIQWVVEHITASYMQKLSVAELAAELGINACHLSRQFTKKIGMSIQEYLLTVRVINAKLYLNKGYSVKEAALMCGFNDPNNFTKLFKKKTGYSPKEWKKKLALSEDSRSPFQPYPPATAPLAKK
ncbi:MAG: AraC family transcriptional regulator [Oscillospiraceae bacterium]|nr:AraC family transcriptional regulator [Oscillospiraceae bacterium]